MQSIENLKRQAKRLRATLADQGQAISHSQSLELLAKQMGHRDWNTLHASTGNRAAAVPTSVGAKIAGTYLGQPFDGEVIGIQSLSPGRFRVTLEFNEPVDVVTFDSFSAFRKRVSATIGEDGRSRERTSNGEPQLQLSL